MRLSTPLLSLILAIAIAGCGTAALAQMGQAPMAPAGGVVNRAVQGFANLDANGPGWLYYGVNAADRGLGYNGSYMTLGGFIPVSEDDLGGFWSADLRSHLSVHGGFFSNVGMVRKQFLGGTLLGLGVYWDYDGDLNQYPTGGAPGTSQYGQFGHAYNQVGVSGEWLTDFGNIRSNGYIPVGTTAYTVGAPGMPFVGNQLLCQYGLDTALAGADLEVGAYIPGLADWAGMISVGGYTFGNERYNWGTGSQAGNDVVPFFGGVYTRLDLTLVQNWDFSLQYNNDSYFDSTGFARLTYRMGGSRRRNVPDQMEQPMMRNEHIVRAHQTPIVAVNPETNAAWNVIHVDSAAAPRGNGTAETPVQTLAAAQALAANPYDIVFVSTGNSATTPYASNWVFQADNQILVGQGSSLQLNTATCGYRSFFATGPATAYPVLTSSGNAITLRNGAIVDHFRIENAPVGILADNTLTTGANVNDVQIVTKAGQTGVSMVGVPSGEVNFYNMHVTNAGRGLRVDGGAPDVNFQGLIASTAATDESILVENLSGGSVSINRTTDTLATPVARNPLLVATASFAVRDTASAAPAAIQVTSNTGAVVAVGPTTITRPTQQGVAVQSNAGTSAVTFADLVVVDAAAEAFSSQSNTNTTIGIEGRSSLSSQSSTLPVFASNDDATLLMTLQSMTSKTVAPVPAIVLQGTSTGFLDITDTFTVERANPTPPPASIPAPGTNANVSNTTGVTVTLP
ncbi:MAG: hypothetical protein NTW36_09075 [Planctomycetia bacterium]|nr:hypothetical protein [Planctomycetia bacterium]